MSDKLPSCKDPDDEGDILTQNVTDMVKRVRKSKPVLLILDGGLGEGKTTLAVKVADIINKANGLDVVEFKGPQYAFGSDEFKKKLIDCYDLKLPAIIYDESGDYDRRQSLTTINKLLNRTFEMFRTFKIIVILCLPNFKTLDERLFDNGIPRLLLHVYGKTEKRSHYKGYDIKNMAYLRAKMSDKHYVLKAEAYNIQTANFYGSFTDLTPARSKALDELSTAKKREFILNISGDPGTNINLKDDFNFDLDKIERKTRGGFY